MIVSPFGPGWAWDDYMEELYASQNFISRIYGNIVNLKFIRVKTDVIMLSQRYFKRKLEHNAAFFYRITLDTEFTPDYKTIVQAGDSNIAKLNTQKFIINRSRTSNKLNRYQGNSIVSNTKIPFVSQFGNKTTVEILKDDFQLQQDDLKGSSWSKKSLKTLELLPTSVGIKSSTPNPPIPFLNP